MTSLGEVYGGPANGTLRRLYFGTGLFVLGACMVVAGIVVATTDVLAPLGVGVLGAREIAGVLAGLGAPAVFVGIFTVLPASDLERAAAAVGAGVAVLGVLLFLHAYPGRWTGGSPNLSFPVTAVYFLGTITTFWSMFTAIVSFKTRNDPGGTVILERIVRASMGSGSGGEVEAQSRGREALGGVGVLGGVDRDPVMEESAASDGGTEADDLRTPGVGTEPGSPEAADRYCGNCTHFEYVHTEEGIQPYCGFHDEVMDDTDPCERWEPNR